MQLKTLMMRSKPFTISITASPNVIKVFHNVIKAVHDAVKALQGAFNLEIYLKSQTLVFQNKLSQDCITNFCMESIDLFFGLTRSLRTWGIKSACDLCLGGNGCRAPLNLAEFQVSFGYWLRGQRRSSPIY